MFGQNNEVGFGWTQCNDDFDNDGDGWVDADDTGCTDGFDNDGDGWVDADDTGCTDGFDNDES